MPALIIIIVVLLLFLILPVGADAAYREDVFGLKIKLGPFRIRVLPKKETKPKKEKKKKPKPEAGKKHDTEKPKPGLSDFLEIAKLIFKILTRFRHCLSIDRFLLHFISAAEDPYDAIMQYGYLNAGLSVLAPLLHRAFKIREEEILLDVDVTTSKPVIELRLIATLQIWEIFYIGFCAGFGFLRWFLPFRKAAKAKAKAEKAVGARPVEQKG